jgi:RNA polymerase sigma factor (sigma-70 family)
VTTVFTTVCTVGAATNAELIQGVIHGDRAAWGELVERFSQTVWMATAKYELDRATRLDVVQTVWLRLHDRVSQVRDPDRIAGWLSITARNECVNVLRRRSRTFSLAEDYEVPSDDPPAETNLERRHNIAAVAEALSELDARCAELLQLLAADPAPSYEDISHMLDIPVGSIGPTRARCLQKLRSRPAIARIIHDL